MTLPYGDLGESWRAARRPAAGIHLDSAACSRSSRLVLEAVAKYAGEESEVGGYVAEANAEPALRQARSAIGTLVGLSGDDVVFVDSATTALARLLQAWRLPAGTRVGCLIGEYGDNLAAFRDAGLQPVLISADTDGRLDPGALRDLLRDRPPTLVHLTVMGSHRGVVQPAHEVAEVCREFDVALVLDAAQAFGHVDCAVGADAVYSTSRKWLTGPRGVGVLAVGQSLALRLPLVQDAEHPPENAAPVRVLESAEGHIAGRVGLGLAVQEHVAAGPERVHARLSALGRLTRELCGEVGGWRVHEPTEEPSAVTTLAPPPGVDVAETRARLLREHRILTTAIPPDRAPLEMTGPVLRISPHLDTTADDLRALAAALQAITGRLDQPV